MPGRGASLLKKVVWICWRHQSGFRVEAPCGQHTSILSSSAPGEGIVDYTCTVQRSMATWTEIHALSKRWATLCNSDLVNVDFVAVPKPMQRFSPRAAFFETKAHVNICWGTSNSFKSPIPFFVNNPGIITDKVIASWENGSFQRKLSTGRAAINAFGDAVTRQRDRPRMESNSMTDSGGWNSRYSSKLSKNRCSSYSSDSLFGSSMHNEYQCSVALEDSSLMAGLKIREGTRSNVARHRVHAGEFAEILAVAPEIRPNVPVKAGTLPARVIKADFNSELRLIHETAVVHPDALLGEGVEIGAFCTVGSQVKLGNGCKLQPSCHIFGDTQLGENCVLSTGAVVGADIPGHTVIGDNNAIGHYAVVGVKCQDMKYKEGDECFLYIGNNNDIREFASIHRSSKPNDNTILGHDNLIMGSCHVAHDCKIGNGNILANGTLLGGHVVVEDLVHTGGGVAVHQFCNVGSYAFLAGGSMVDRDVPMYVMVAGDRAELRGLNLEGLRRCGFSDLEIRSIRKAYQKLFMNSANSGGMEERLFDLEQDAGLAAVPAVSLMVQSVRDCFGEKRRGICRSKHWAPVWRACENDICS